mgnify:CR=1 FL=1
MVQDEFRAGNTGMYVYGSWAIDTLNEDGVNYGVTTIPAFADAGQVFCQHLKLFRTFYVQRQQAQRRRMGIH